MVLGLGRGPVVSAGGGRIDRVVDPSDINGVLQQAAELLGERRQRPRVDTKLCIHLEGIGNCIAKAISSTSLFVAADKTMATCKTVEISVVTAEDKLACRATVLRVGPGRSGEQGMVLGIPEHAMNFRAFLDATVRKALLVEQSRKASTADEKAQVQAQALEELRESLSAEIEQLRHAQAVLRRTVESQVGLIQSLHQRIEAQGRGQQNPHTPSEDTDEFEEATKILEFGESQALAEMSLWGQKRKQMQGTADRKITQVQEVKKQLTSRLHQIAASFRKGSSSWSYVAVAAILVAFLTTLVALALYLKGINKPLASSTSKAGTAAVIKAPVPTVEQLSDGDQLRGGSDG
jgi:hypothetical protein